MVTLQRASSTVIDVFDDPISVERFRLWALTKDMDAEAKDRVLAELRPMAEQTHPGEQRDVFMADVELATGVPRAIIEWAWGWRTEMPERCPHCNGSGVGSRP